MDTPERWLTLWQVPETKNLKGTALNEVLESPREYKRRREMFLDQQFHERYPEGMFILQRRWYPNRRDDTEEIKEFAIYWHPHRRHGTCDRNHCQEGEYPNSRMIAALYQTFEGEYHRQGLRYEDYQNNSFGKCTYYKSLPTTIAAARRLNLPEELIKGFLERYGEMRLDSQ